MMILTVVDERHCAYSFITDSHNRIMYKLDDILSTWEFVADADLNCVRPSNKEHMALVCLEFLGRRWPDSYFNVLGEVF